MSSTLSRLAVCKACKRNATMSQCFATILCVAMLFTISSCATSPPSEADTQMRVGELLARGQSLGKEKRYQEALDLFREAEKLKPTDLRVIYDIGTALRYLGRYRESLSYLTKAVELAPQDPRNLNTYAQIGIIRRDIGDNLAAIEAFKSALTNKPDDYRLLAYLGDLYYKTNQYDLCKQYIALFREAVAAQRSALLSDDDRREVHAAMVQLDAYMLAIEQGRVGR